MRSKMEKQSPDPRLEKWRALFDSMYEHLNGGGVQLALMTHKIVTEPFPGDVRMPSERKAMLVEASGGRASAEFIEYMVTIGGDKDPANALKVFLSGSPNVKEWLKIPGNLRVTIMSKPIPVIRYGARSVTDCDLKSWEALTPAEFRRAISVADYCERSLHEQLARVGRRATPTVDYVVHENGIRVPRKHDFSFEKWIDAIEQSARFLPKAQLDRLRKISARMGGYAAIDKG